MGESASAIFCTPSGVTSNSHAGLGLGNLNLIRFQSRLYLYERQSWLSSEDRLPRIIYYGAAASRRNRAQHLRLYGLLSAQMATAFIRRFRGIYRGVSATGSSAGYSTARVRADRDDSLRRNGKR